MTLNLVMLIALLPCLASGQETPGFTRCDEPTAAKSVVGTWLHIAVQSHGQYLGMRVWTQLELLAGGEAIENYFSEDPNLSDVPAFSRLISTWTNGSFTNPDPDKGSYEVIRLEPYLSANYNPSTNSYADQRRNVTHHLGLSRAGRLRLGPDLPERFINPQFPTLGLPGHRRRECELGLVQDAFALILKNSANWRVESRSRFALTDQLGRKAARPRLKGHHISRARLPFEQPAFQIALHLRVILPVKHILQFVRIFSQVV